MSDEASEQVGTELLFENDRIRVWNLVLKPGEPSPRHRHTRDYVFVHVSASTIEAHEGEGAPSVEACDPGYVQYTEVGTGIEHYIVNRGANPHQEILVEFLGPSRAASPQEPRTNGRSRPVRR